MYDRRKHAAAIFTMAFVTALSQTASCCRPEGASTTALVRGAGNEHDIFRTRRLGWAGPTPSDAVRRIGAFAATARRFSR
jgi:hypothetical protein